MDARIAKTVAGGKSEYYLRDHTGRELAVYDMGSNYRKSLNMYGIGLAGRYDKDSAFYSRSFYVKDHLGSIRQTLRGSATVAGQDYYPYGEVLRAYNTGIGAEKYKFTEKERDIETGLDYFGARYYDGRIDMKKALNSLFKAFVFCSGKGGIRTPDASYPA